MNIDLEKSNKREMFAQFLSNPDRAELGNVKKLCKEFPYVSALWFIYARVSYLQKTPDAAEVYKKAALFSPDVEKLREFVFGPSVIDEEVEYIETEEYDMQTVDQDKSESTDEQSTEMILLSPVNSSDEKDSDTEIADQAHEGGTPSRYLDDWMTYSYVWWLQKTRMEYAETYQPYASRTFSEKENRI